ncbi:MAG TPA: chemotaxis protein CheB [Actinomycetota bacterium]|nr:chemotaxis protein CheB [Actinomycetota bacterium]
MQNRDIVTIGASAGGIEALTRLCAALPRDLEAAVFVVLHIQPLATSVLPQILDRAGPLTVEHARDGLPPERRRIYVAPPDHHLVVADGCMRLSRSPRQNGHRPSVDALFRSAARVHGPRVVGVVLSGALDDGSAGLAEIKRAGGMAVVQEPADAATPDMPRNAMRAVAPDHVATAPEIASILAASAKQAVQPEDPTVTEPSDAPGTPLELEGSLSGQPGAGGASGLTCPSCGGAVWEGEHGRFGCHIGHQFSLESIFAAQSEALESAILIALRAMREKAALALKLAERMADDYPATGRRFERQADELEQATTQLQEALDRSAQVAWEPGGAAVEAAPKRP